MSRVPLRLLTIVSTLVLSFSLVQCDSGTVDPEPGPVSVTAPIAFNVQLDDPTNLGDARDLVVTFESPTDLSLIKEYRVLLVASDAAAAFNRASAEAIAAGQYLVHAPTSGMQRVPLPQDAVDVTGQPIAEGSSYVAFVLSVAGGTATSNNLSAPSNPMGFAETSIKITFVGNAGIIIEDDQRRVIIDGLTSSLAGWIPLGTADVTKLTAGTAPFDGISVVMTTHNHGDHYSPSVISNFMASNVAATFVGPPAVRSGLSLGSRAVDVAPARGERETITVDGIRIDALSLRHFDQFGNDFSTTENFGYIVHMGGLKVLHLGDVHYSAANFAPFDLASEGIDVVVLPTFNTLLSSENAAVIESSVAPRNVIALHFQRPVVGNEASRAATLFGATTTFTKALQFARY